MGRGGWVIWPAQNVQWRAKIHPPSTLRTLFGRQRAVTHPHLAHVPTRAPQCGKWPFSQIDVELLTGPTQWPGHTGSLGGSVGLGTTALGFPENGAAACIVGQFPLGCPPRERGDPPRHSVPRPTPPRSETCACSPSTQLRHPRRCPAWGLTCRNLGVRFLGWCSGGDFQPNRVRKVANMSLFWGSGLLYTTTTVVSIWRSGQRPTTTGRAAHANPVVQNGGFSTLRRAASGRA